MESKKETYLRIIDDMFSIQCPLCEKYYGGWLKDFVSDKLCIKCDDHGIIFLCIGRPDMNTNKRPDKEYCFAKVIGGHDYKCLKLVSINSSRTECIFKVGIIEVNGCIKLSELDNIVCGNPNMDITSVIVDNYNPVPKEGIIIDNLEDIDPLYIKGKCASCSSEEKFYIFKDLFMEF